MVMRALVGKAETDRDDIEEHRPLAGAAEIIAGMETQLIDAGFHRLAGQQRRVAAAVVIGLDRLDQQQGIALDPVEIDAQPPGRLAERGIEHMSRQPTARLRLRMHAFSSRT